jgi:hypothetical protein
LLSRPFESAEIKTARPIGRADCGSRHRREGRGSSGDGSENSEGSGIDIAEPAMMGGYCIQEKQFLG